MGQLAPAASNFYSFFFRSLLPNNNHLLQNHFCNGTPPFRKFANNMISWKKGFFFQGRKLKSTFTEKVKGDIPGRPEPAAFRVLS